MVSITNATHAGGTPQSPASRAICDFMISKIISSSPQYVVSFIMCTPSKCSFRFHEMENDKSSSNQKKSNQIITISGIMHNINK